MTESRKELEEQIKAIKSEIHDLSNQESDLKKQLGLNLMSSDGVTHLLDRVWEPTYRGTDMILRSKYFEDDPELIDTFDDCRTHGSVDLTEETHMCLRDIEENESVKYFEILGGFSHGTANLVALIKSRELKLDMEHLDDFMKYLHNNISELQTDMLLLGGLKDNG